MDVLEVKRTLGGEERTYACRALECSPERAVLLYTLPRDGRVAGLSLPAGTLTIAYYWAERPYNVYHWIAPDRTTLAYYFNLSGPARITSDRLEWEDLEVDVLVPLGGRPQVLDEDRVPAGAAGQLPEIAAARDRVLREYPAVTERIEAASRALLAQDPALFAARPEGA